jgi:hypothetical protein
MSPRATASTEANQAFLADASNAASTPSPEVPRLLDFRYKPQSMLLSARSPDAQTLTVLDYWDHRDCDHGSQAWWSPR